MKIVQSYWSKPCQTRTRSPYRHANACGWPDKRYNYFSWALSVLQFRTFYDKVELVTDRAGYELLIERLQLPYTDVKIVLDDLNGYHEDLYALGKIYAYAIQDEPFIHADGDVAIWERFDKDFEESPLLCQNKEQGDDYNRWYSQVFFEVARNFQYYPKELDRSITKNGGIIAVNAGILGGSNIHFYKYYTKIAFEFIDRNFDRLSSINIKFFNTIFEQFLFYALAEERNEKLSLYKPDYVSFWHDLTDFTGVPNRVKYIHTIGDRKKQKQIVESLEYHLLLNYPEYYFKIINLLRTNKI